MKGIGLLLLLGLLPVLVPAAELKIGAVSLVRILDKVPQAEQADKRLQSEFGPRKRALDDAQKSLRNLEQKLSKDTEALGEAQRRKLERDIIAQRREIQRSTQEFREDFNLRRNEELGKLQQQIMEVINSVAREEGFDLILNEGGVLYAGERVDITDRVVQRLNKR